MPKAPRRPNFLLIMTDQQKATAINLYGGQVRTPNLERIARNGIVYEHAFTPHPLCVPARVSLWTGRWPHSHGARTNEIPMPPGETHLVQLLHAAGYRIGLSGKNHCFRREDFERYFHHVFLAGHGDRIGPDLASGVTLVNSDMPSAPGSRPQANLRREPGYLRPVAQVRSEPPEASATYQVTEDACRFLEAHTAEPFCLWVSIPDPHEPYQVPEPYASLYPSESIKLPPWRDGEFEDKPERQRVYRQLLDWDSLTENDARLAMSIYFGMIAFIDERVGVLLDTLERLGLREDTIVIFCSDHGDFIGEHHSLIKCNAFYDCLTRVPLLFSYPRAVPGGQRRPELVSLVDIMPTLLALAGLPIPAAVQGRVLPGTPGAGPAREAIYSEYGAGGPPVTLEDVDRHFPPGTPRPLHPFLREREAQGHGKMVRTHRWKYTHDVTGEVDELYDLESDPWELTNLASLAGGSASQTPTSTPTTGDTDGSSELVDYSQVISEMRRYLADWLLETENAHPVPLYFHPFWPPKSPPPLTPSTPSPTGGPLHTR